MLIIGFGVSEVLLGTLVFRCEICGNHAAHQLTKQKPQVLTFLHSAVLGRYEIPRQLYRLRADYRGQQGAGGSSGPAGRSEPAVIRPSFHFTARPGDQRPDARSGLISM